jgi:hypothetical protein
MIIALMGGDFWVDVRYYRALAQTQGTGRVSSGIFDLVQYLRDERVNRVIACDWRLLQLVQYASSGQINGEEVIVGESDSSVAHENVPPSFFRMLGKSLQRPGNVYLFYAPDYELYKRREAFIEYLENHKLSYKLKILYDRNGPIYYVYRVGSTYELRKAAWQSTGDRPPRLLRVKGGSPSRKARPVRELVCGCRVK